MKSALLINSFAKMVQALQLRERELATGARRIARADQRHAESRRRVEAAHADLLATIETIPAALMIFNVDGSVRLRNRAATDVFGIEPQNPELRKNYWGRFKRIAKDGSPIPPDEWISARALRGDTARNEELEIHHPGRPRVPDSCQRCAAAQRARPRRRRGGGVPGHLAAARSRSHEGRVRVDRQPRAAHAADLDSRLGAAGARRAGLGARTRSIATCCRSR